MAHPRLIAVRDALLAAIQDREPNSLIFWFWDQVESVRPHYAERLSSCWYPKCWRTFILIRGGFRL
jgi:hypothetical protein